jgi:hypothetical protein
MKFLKFARKTMSISMPLTTIITETSKYFKHVHSCLSKQSRARIPRALEENTNDIKTTPITEESLIDNA